MSWWFYLYFVKKRVYLKKTISGRFGMEMLLFRSLVFLVLGVITYLVQRFVLKKPADQRQKTLVNLLIFWLGSSLIWGLDKLWPGTGNLLVSFFVLFLVWFFLDLIVLTLVIKTVKQRRPWQLALRVLLGLGGAVILYNFLT